jgi:hypothetical protein
VDKRRGGFPGSGNGGQAVFGCAVCAAKLGHYSLAVRIRFFWACWALAGLRAARADLQLSSRSAYLSALGSLGFPSRYGHPLLPLRPLLRPLVPLSTTVLSHHRTIARTLTTNPTSRASVEPNQPSDADILRC